MLYSLTELNFNLTLPSSALRLLIEGEGEAQTCTNKKSPWKELWRQDYA
jgi:hypothetical protein